MILTTFSQTYPIRRTTNRDPERNLCNNIHDRERLAAFDYGRERAKDIEGLAAVAADPRLYSH